MNDQLKNVRGGIDRLKDFGTSKRFYAFLICLVISTCIWLLIALSKNYTTVIRFPVVYANLPTEQVVTNELPEEVSLQVQSYGFQLLSYKVFGGAPITIDAADYESKPLGNIYTSFVLTKSLLNEISDQLDGETNVTRVWPDTIFMNFSDLMDKQLSVRPIIDLTFKDQFKQLGEIKIDPATVFVSGPVSVLDTMEYLYTLPITMNDVSEDVTVTTRYTVSNIKDMEFSNDGVLVTVPVDEFTEGDMEVEIIAVNVPAGYDYKVFPSQAIISYNVGMKDYDRIRAEMFQAVVELPDSADRVGQTEFQLYLTRQPEEVQGVRIEPQQVEVILRSSGDPEE